MPPVAYYWLPPMTISGLYAIADSSYDPFGSLAVLARAYLDGGCRVVQLRMKDAGIGDQGSGIGLMRNVAVEIMKLKAEYDFLFIVNDYVDLALDLGADGVHVGANDEGVGSIRARAGGRLIVGYSAHSLDEAVTAARSGADYVAFGAIFPTKTKGPGHPVQGIDKLASVVRAVGRPVVAIGGIGRDNIDDVVQAGAASAAMITALAEAPDVAAETRWFVNRIEGACRGLDG